MVAPLQSLRACSWAWPRWIPLAATAALLFLEQKWAEDVNLAFFKVNVWVGFAVLAMVLIARAATCGALWRGALPDRHDRRFGQRVRGRLRAPLPGEKFLVLSDWARQVLHDETGLKPSDLEPHVKKVFADADLAAPFSSGSNRYDALVVIPCSVSTLAKIAAGIADTLITRAAAGGA